MGAQCACACVWVWTVKHTFAKWATETKCYYTTGARIITDLDMHAVIIVTIRHARNHIIGLYHDVWIAAIASSRTSLATQTAATCVRFHGRCERHVCVTMQVTFLTRKSALIYRRGLRQRVASLTLDCNGVFAIKAYWEQSEAVHWRQWRHGKCYISSSSTV